MSLLVIIYVIIRDCLELLKVFNKWIITYVPTKTNSAADLLAKDAINMAFITYWSNESPKWFESLIKEKLYVPEV